MNETIQLIQNHRSIRSFLDKDIDNEIIDEILKSSQAMPSSINGQQTSVIVIRDKETKAKIAHLAGGQQWVEDAPVFLIYVLDFYKTHLAAKKNGLTQVIHESVEGTMVGTFDSGLAMAAAIISAESLGLGIVPIGGVRKNPGELIKLLNLPEYVYPAVGLAVGYPKDNSHKKPRLPFETFKHEESYHTEGLEKAIEQYDTEMKGYLKEIGREQEGNWSKLTSGIYQYVYYPEVYPTMKEQKFSNDK
ncbi:NADPH-dependent oxidoreductase [Anaerocolumna cellulosilytica]|uniref:NADPH-dependent oxidoreductase n=1 Tax=Anaerocolumna cellulosilytica TaxID=433286 RepID=A0A6S6QML0_9FIRM|nr:NADPH-dependent oxidoreductase [Anaerocolumna cellulosilytica]MBB5197945.1 FMN reductase [NAD(P)H] [Anaerocolumna cellulosilytica]BCJ92583.1 NADPH-dependent oxidoreductase [Anaerocolumna cellulosilytica]